MIGENAGYAQKTDIACKLLEVGLKGRLGRFATIRKNEDMYNGITSVALKGRNNVPFDCFVMRGFVDTLLAEVDDDAVIDFGPKRQQDKMAADKITAAWNIEAGPDKGAWNDKIMDAKFLASFAGRGFLKFYAEGVPRFKTDLSVCDHYDMVTEVRGGGHLDTHLYKFQMNIFRTKKQLLDGVSDGYYDRHQVALLCTRYASTDFQKKNEEIINTKADRWLNIGVDADYDTFVGQQLYRLTEGVVNFDGKWYYIVFSKETKTWIRFQPLEEVFEVAKYYPGRGPWTSFSTHRHPFLFWNQAPADDIRPIGYTMKKLVNLTLDNLEKRNWDMTAYDPKVFTDPTQLLWRQDGLARATLKPGQDISKGIFKFQTPDTTSITINMVEWLNNFIGQKTGITPETQGAAQTDKVGIAVQNLQQTSKRLMLTNKTIRAAYTDLGTLFDFGMYEHLREPYAVKLIGNEGVRWEEEITRKDIDAEFTISPRSSVENNRITSEESNKKSQELDKIAGNKSLLVETNVKWLVREKLKAAGYKDDQIRVGLDPLSDGEEEVQAKAAEAIQDIIENKPHVPLYRGATTGFIQKIIGFAEDKFPLVPVAEWKTMRGSELKRYKVQLKKFDRLVSYAEQHIPIAAYNMERRFVQQVITQSSQSMAALPAGNGAQPVNPEATPAAPTQVIN